MITNTQNGKRYIGKTSKQISTRFAGHLYSANRGCETYFYNAIRKHGAKAFVVSLVEEVSKEDLSVKEIFYIANIKPEYNTTKGGDGTSLIYKTHFITDGIVQRRVPIHLPIQEGFVKGVKPETKTKLRLGRLGKTNSVSTRKS